MSARPSDQLQGSPPKTTKTNQYNTGMIVVRTSKNLEIRVQWMSEYMDPCNIYFYFLRRWWLHGLYIGFIFNIFLSLETALRILIPNYVNKRVKCFDCQRLEHIDHYTYIMRIAAMLGCMSACSLYNKLSSHSVLTEQCGLLIFDIPVLRSHV